MLIEASARSVLSSVGFLRESIFSFNHKTARIKIAIETTIGGGELQDAVVRVGDATRVVLLIAFVPDHLLALGIRQYLHRTTQHHTFETFSVTEIDRHW